MKATNPVPPGYKRTKVGVIPEEWEVVKLGDIASRSTQKNVENIIDVVFSNSALDGIVMQNDYFDKDIANRNNLSGYYIVNPGDFVYNPRISKYAPAGPINRNNTGKTGIVSPLYTVFCIEDSECIRFFEYYFKSTLWLSYMNSIANYGARHDRMNITVNDFMKMPLPLPPLKEQQKIAQILSTWDEAIAKLEALIEAKERFKKGLMQQLLSTKLRFPGFDGEWEEVRLGEVATVVMGQSPSSKSYNEEGRGVPLIQGNADCENRKTAPRMNTTKPTKMCEKGDIIMTVRAPVGYVSKSHHNACVGRGVCAIRPHSQNNFLYYFLIMYEERWAKFSQGSTFTAVNSQDIKRLKVPHPSIEEQEKIVEVLSALEREIKLLKGEFEALKEQKRGLMQKLLSGEVRVKL